MFDNVVPVAGVRREMLAADYWIDKITEPDKILCDRSALENANQRILNAVQQLFDFRTAAGNLSREQILDKLAQYDFLAEKQLYMNGKLLDAVDWQAFFDNKNAGELDKVCVQYALAVRRLNVRSFPTCGFVYGESSEYPVVDRFQETHVEPGQPLLVMQDSRDGKWCFVQLFNYCGWVEKDGLALFAKAQWDEYLQNYDSKFLMITGARVHIPAGYLPQSKAVVLSMGARLPLWYGAAGAVVALQNSCGCHVVALPVRQADGSGSIEPLLIPMANDVCVGYLPCTAENIVQQAFKLQGERYGWGGLYESWDCSGLIMACYLSCGLVLPRNCSVEEQYAALAAKVDFSETDSLEKRVEKMRTLSPGAAVFSDGHIMMYLGEVGGSHYVIHSTSGGLDENGNVLNCVLVTNLQSVVPGKRRLLERVFAAGVFY